MWAAEGRLFCTRKVGWGGLGDVGMGMGDDARGLRYAACGEAFGDAEAGVRARDARSGSSIERFFARSDLCTKLRRGPPPLGVSFELEAGGRGDGDGAGAGKGAGASGGGRACASFSRPPADDNDNDGSLSRSLSLSLSLSRSFLLSPSFWLSRCAWPCFDGRRCGC